MQDDEAAGLLPRGGLLLPGGCSGRDGVPHEGM